MKHTTPTTPTDTHAQAGFTIVELMIATIVFSTVLLVITTGVLSFTRSYFRGVNDSTTQNTARLAIERISQAVQFSSTNPVTSSSGTTQAICAGGEQYIYNLGVQPSATTPAAVGLYARSYSGSGCIIPASTTTMTDGTELLTARIRLTDVSMAPVAGISNTYSISLRLAYGDNDLLCAPTAQVGSCLTTAATLPSNKLVTNDVVCKTITGFQFCSIAALGTTIQQRAVN